MAVTVISYDGWQETIEAAKSRFWEKVKKTPDCWLWMATKSNKGYGLFNLWQQGVGRTISAHRFAWETRVGPMPLGMTLDHLCRNHACVRPEHLRIVTHRENIFAFGSLSLPKLFAERTHCNRGHAFTPENTGYNKRDGSRYCRICARERMKNQQAKVKY